MTYGDIRFRLTKLLPGIDHDLLDGWIIDRYTEILDSLKWQRRQKKAIIQTVAPYETGTLALTFGSNAVTGTGTTFTSAMTGRLLHIPGLSAPYTFTYVSATSGTLDRTYEGATAAASAYKIAQHIYALPVDCRVLEAVVNLEDDDPLLERDRPTEWNRTSVTYGSPSSYRKTFDSATTMQIAVWPIPDDVRALEVEYIAEETGFGATAGTTLLPWLRPGCIVAGVQSDGQAFLGELGLSNHYSERFGELLGAMSKTRTANTPAKTIRISSRFKTPARDDSYHEARKRQM